MASPETETTETPLITLSRLALAGAIVFACLTAQPVVHAIPDLLEQFKVLNVNVAEAVKAVRDWHVFQDQSRR